MGRSRSPGRTWHPRALPTFRPPELRLLALVLLLAGAFAGALPATASPDAETDAAEPGTPWVGGPLEVAWNDDAGRAVTLPLVTSGDHLLVTTTDRKIFCYELGTGKKTWKRRFKVDLPTAPAVLARPGPESETVPSGTKSGTPGLVFLQVGAREGAELHALRLEDGGDEWKLPSYPRATQLLVQEEGLLVLDLAGTLQCVDPEGGSLRWDHDGFGWDPPGLARGRDALFVLARSDSLLALDPATGKTLWAASIPGRYVARPQLDGGRLLLSTTEGQLYEVQASDGRVRALGPRRPQQLLPPVPIGGRVLTVSSDGWVEAGDDLGPGSPAEGGAAWSADLGESVRGTPLAAGGLLLVPTSAGRLVALRGDTGAQVWSLELGDRLAAAPLLTDRYLVVATNQGDVYAYVH